MSSDTSLMQAFRDLHAAGTFVMPNPYDIGSARLLAAMGFPALATTSAGFAATLGRTDMAVTRDELVAHVSAIATATRLPLNVDAERCFADDLEGVAATVRLLADAGAAGCSIEDWDPARGQIDERSRAVDRVAAAASAAAESGLVLTARCENLLHGVRDLDDTLARLDAYREAGAAALYAPGLSDLADIARVVEIGLPVNVLLLPGGPTVDELSAVGVRRISLGGALSSVAHGAVVALAQGVLDTGTLDRSLPKVSWTLVTQAFATGPNG
jgi:2-methylisocitrate lyase-like PEP mutase family enzyme